MLVDLFDFDLPGERIAQNPLPRGASRLLSLDRRTGEVRHLRFADLPGLLGSGDLLVRNDARVVPARLLGRDASGREVELFVLEPGAGETALCLARPGRRAKAGAEIALPAGVKARVLEVFSDGKRRVAFSPPLGAELLEKIGHVPLPPYIKRPDTPQDRERYQTVFARVSGAVAAPTAGLHFPEEMFPLLRQRGVAIADLSLLVGAGTFKPVTCQDTDDHVLEAEEVRIPEETVRLLLDTKKRGGRVVAVGTTVTRALETWARDGHTHFSTSLFITPGFEFRAVDALLTNFHLPRSTLLMLVCAFAGRERVLSAYRQAVAERYRFYSYGDAMFIA